MILNINKKQYRKLVELLAIAQTEIEAFAEYDLFEENEHEEYQQVLHSIFKHSAKMDCEDAITYDTQLEEWHVTEPLFEYWHNKKFQVNLDTFKEQLAFYMAKKQLVLNQQINQLPDQEAMMQAIYELADQYQPMLDEHGLALLEWTTEEKLIKQYPSLDIEEFYMVQALSLNPKSNLIEEILNSEEFDIEAFLKESNLPAQLENTQKEQTKNNNVIDFPTNSQTAIEPKTLQLKIQLNGAKPPVWRRIEVPSTLNLYQLHQIIQELFGLFEIHLYDFNFGHNVINENQEQDFKLQQLIGTTDVLNYEYDFGDSWRFTITLEETKDYKTNKFKDVKAICITGKRGAIIEDIGGVPVLNELAENLKNGKPIPEHLAEFYLAENLKLTIETFDKNKINTDLKQLTQAW